MRISPNSIARPRSGSILVIVLAMLALFAVVGLSFVLYSESEATSFRNAAAAVNADSPPDPQQAAEKYLAGLVYDVGDTSDDDLSNPIRGHGLARSKYGWNPGTPGLFPHPYGDHPLAQLAIPGVGPTPPYKIVNFSWQPGGYVVDPERDYPTNLTPAPRANSGAALPGTYYSRATGYTYPDRLNFYLAMQDPTTGRIVTPSFFRESLFKSLDPSNLNWTNPEGALMLLRPRPAPGEHPNFPQVPANADGTYTGDVANMKFTAGIQQNDSLWMDAGGPVLTWRNKKYKAMVAPLILDLSSRVNLSVSGNIRPATPSSIPSGHPRHTSNQGFGPWEINPTTLMPNPAVANSELLALIQSRWPAAPAPGQIGTLTDFSPYDPALQVRINDGLLPPAYSRLDVDGLTTAPGLDPMVVPGPGAASVFPTYPNTRFPDNSAAWLTKVQSHPHFFNPLLLSRGRANATGKNRPFGLDDTVLHAARSSDPKARYLGTQYASAAPTAMNSDFFRNATTPFSVSQTLSTIDIPTGPTTTAKLGPVDLNRPLADYRKNVNLPLSPLNMWASNTAQFAQARRDRQMLARDIFVRLAALSNLGGNVYLTTIDGAKVAYSEASGYLAINLNPAVPAELSQLGTLRDVAQLAANIVDAIDSDDISTQFVWNPTAVSLTNNPLDPSADASNFAAAEIANRVVFGNELPKLVLNEIYSGVANARDELHPAQKATSPLMRQFWIELHNPTPLDAVRPDNGSARLKYEQNVTSLIDPVSGAAAAYTGATFNPYQIELAEIAVLNAVTKPYTDFISNTNPSALSIDTSSIPGLTVLSRINAFTHDSAAPSAAAKLAATPDELNLVRPFTAQASYDGLNHGYYVVGPRDPFPSGGVTNTLSLPDGGLPTGAAPVAALTYQATAAAPTDNEIVAQAGKTYAVLLRRLANPYSPYDAVTNPFITVDFMEGVPTRDRAEFQSAGPHAPTGGASVGRKHPYILSDSGSLTIVSFSDQTANGVVPPHTFFAQNSNFQNSRNNQLYGPYWMKHFDRRLINSTELLFVNRYSNAKSLTSFYSFSNNDSSGVTNGAGGPFADTRIFRILTIGNLMPGIPLGSREPGKLNLNTINDIRLLKAVMDPQAGNTYDDSPQVPLNIGYVTKLWQYYFVPPTVTIPPFGLPRSPYIVPWQTARENGARRGVDPGDMPFDSSTYADPAYDRLIRSMPGIFASDPFTTPFATGRGDDSYPSYEPLRKMWNSVTTNSDSFLVMLTVGFFEVENAGPFTLANKPRLGKELFDKVPGDFRKQYAAVVDRSNLAVPMNATGQMAFGGAVPDEKPWQAKLTENAYLGTNSITVEAEWTGTTARIWIDGQTVDLAFNKPYRLGHGDAANGLGDGEAVIITAAAQKQKADSSGLPQPVIGQVVLTLSGNLTRHHGASSPFTNVILGNPGPQGTVTMLQLQKRGLVPYFTQLQP